jgi:hypothetical protein
MQAQAPAFLYSVGAFTDLSSNCVIPAPTSSNVPILKASAAYATTYSCTYAAATLGCGVNNDYTQECEMMQGVIGGTISGHFSCQGLDRTTLIPKTCISYYGTNTSTSLGLANGTCTSSTGVGASFSAINNCTITACSTDGMNFHTTTGTNNTCLPTEMTVSIDQQCSGVANGQSLSCSYGNGKSTKSRPITIGCDSTIPIHCTATDGSLKIAKSCSDQQSNGSAYHCRWSPS